MENFVFNNELFDRWLNERSQEILSKAGKEKIGHDEMMVLCLKAQTNHFHHMDLEFRGEFKKIDLKFQMLEEHFDKKFEAIDKKFEQFYKVLMWGFGLLFTSQMAMLLKSFLVQ